jgi:hypothetical protein
VSKTARIEFTAVLGTTSVSVTDAGSAITEHQQHTGLRAAEGAVTMNLEIRV